MPRLKKQPNLAEISELFSDGLKRAAANPSVHSYVPHEKQIIFHSSTARGRLYIGGNRSGKTVGGIVEDVMRLRGQHPFQKVPSAPVKGRILTVSYTEGIQGIIIPELARWIPPSDLINGSWEDSYDKSMRTLTLTNKSTVELMSYDQDLVKFAGTSRDFTHFDEEPPKAIFNECKMRLIDRKGCWYITMTPVEGMTWVFDDVFQPGLDPSSNIDVISIDSSENPHISTDELNEVISDLDDNEKKARKEGKFVQIGGLVFKDFDPSLHIIAPKVPPVGWTHYASMDHGFNNPTVWLWHAVSPEGSIVTYDEIYQNETTIPEFVEMIHEHNSRTDRTPPLLYVGDPAIKQRTAQTGDSAHSTYATRGIPIVLGTRDVTIGVEKMNRYFRQGKWLITEHCPNLIRELQRVRWKVYESAKKRHDNNPREEIHKHHDHAPDSARYFFSLMPDLYLPEAGDDTVARINQTMRELLGPSTVGRPNYDYNLNKPVNTEWTHIDEHLGGIW